MRFRGCFRAVRRADHALPAPQSRPALPASSGLDARIWRLAGPQPLLLVNASRRSGGAVQRNRFRRRVRMALLVLLREEKPAGSFVMWVRPARGSSAGSLAYRDILDRLRLVLRRLGAP